MKLPSLAYQCSCVEERDALLRELKEKGVPVRWRSLPETCRGDGFRYSVKHDYLVVKVSMSSTEVLRADSPRECGVVASRQEFVQRLVEAITQDITTQPKETVFPSPPFKLRVSSPEENEAVQKELFKHGCTWSLSGQKPSHLHHPYLHVDAHRTITYNDCESHYRNSNVKELNVSVEQPQPVVTFTPVAKERQTIKVGQRYTHDGEEWLLAQVDRLRVGLINSTGDRYVDSVLVKHPFDITDEEWKKITSGAKFWPVSC